MIFEKLVDQDWIGFNFIRSGLDSDWNISQSAHLCQVVLSSVATAVFFTRSGVFLFHLGFWGFYWKSGFFSLWSNFRNACYITVFSIHEYSSFTGAMCRVSSQYSWVGLGLTKLFEISVLQIKHWWGIGQYTCLSLICHELVRCAWFWNAFFGFEDAVVENLFIVVQAHCHCDRYECKILGTL